MRILVLRLLKKFVRVFCIGIFFKAYQNIMNCTGGYFVHETIDPIVVFTFIDRDSLHPFSLEPQILDWCMVVQPATVSPPVRFNFQFQEFFGSSYLFLFTSTKFSVELFSI